MRRTINPFLSTILCLAILTGCAQTGQPLVPPDSGQGSRPNANQPSGNGVGQVAPASNAGSQSVSANVSAQQTTVQANLPGTKLSATPAEQISREKLLVMSTPNSGIVDFDQKKFDNLKGNNQIALFFSNQACRDCQQLVKTVKEDKLYLPGGIVVFKLDPSVQTDLAKTYQAKAGQVIILDAKGNVFSVNSVEDLSSLAFSMRKVMEL